MPEDLAPSEGCEKDCCKTYDSYFWYLEVIFDFSDLMEAIAKYLYLSSHGVSLYVSTSGFPQVIFFSSTGN